MKKSGTYSFMPRPSEARTSFFDITANLFDYEACYQQKHLDLRERILQHRKAAQFDSEFPLADSSWFSDDPELAFENVNRNRYFLSERLKPQQKLTVNDFRVKDFVFGSFKWLSLANLEKDVGDFLLMRNHHIVSDRPEHLNEPMNFFFVDVKNILRNVAKEQNTKLAVSSINSLLNYINHVETELAFDDSDRSFISQVRSALEQNIKPQINAVIENANIRSHLSSLMTELEGVIESSNRIVHFSLQDGKVNPHPKIDRGDISDSDLASYPTQALIACANKLAVSTEGLSAVMKEGQQLLLDNPFYVSEKGALEYRANDKLLEHCEDVRLIPNLSLEVKQAYIRSASHVNNLLEFKSMLNQVISLFDEAGQHQLVLGYQKELSSLMQAINIELEQAEKDIKLVMDENQSLKDSLLLRKMNLGFKSSIAEGFKNMLGFSKVIDAEQFIANQDIRQLTATRDEQQRYQQAATSTALLLDQLQTSEKKYLELEGQSFLAPLSADLSKRIEQQVQQTTQLYGKEQAASTEALAPPAAIQQSDSNMGYQCDLVYDVDAAAFACHQGEHNVFIFPNSMMAPAVLEDTYDLTDCRNIVYKGQPSVYCQGTNTSLVYQPRPKSAPGYYASQIGGQIALGLVVAKIGYDIYQWWFAPRELNAREAVDDEEAAVFFDNAFKRLSKIKQKQLSDNKEVEESLSFLLEDLDSELKAHSKGKFYQSTMTSLDERIRYLDASVTPVSSLKAKVQAKALSSLLLKKSGLSHSELNILYQYFIELAKQALNLPLGDNEALVSRFKEVQARCQYSIEMLYEIAELKAMIGNRVAIGAEVVESDVLDTKLAIDQFQYAPSDAPLLTTVESDLELLLDKPLSPFYALATHGLDIEKCMTHNFSFFAPQAPESKSEQPSKTLAF